MIAMSFGVLAQSYAARAKKPQQAARPEPSKQNAVLTEKLDALALSFLSDLNDGQPMRPGQKLYLKAYSTDLVLAKKIVEQAYKNQSGKVTVEILEPEIEELKNKYGLQDFDAVREAKRRNQDKSSPIDLTDMKNLSIDKYKQFGISLKESIELRDAIKTDIDPRTQSLLEISPAEILNTCLNLKDGQPLVLSGERDHLPQLLEIAEEAAKRGSKLINISVQEKKEYSPSQAMYQFAPASVIKDLDESAGKLYQEYADKEVAIFRFQGADPDYNSVLSDAQKQIKVQRNAEIGKQVSPARQKMLEKKLPWCGYYLPTAISAKAAGYGDDLRQAAIDARKVNRFGRLNEHAANMAARAKKLDALLAEGYNQLHFISSDDDGQATDLRVRIANDSRFASVGDCYTADGRQYMPNVPSEEFFTSPDCTLVSGHATTTKPVSVAGTTVKNARFEFKADGRVDLDKLSAAEGLPALRQWFKSKQVTNSDDQILKLGEVALVADSPIDSLGKIFNMIILDENAASHIAFGNALAPYTTPAAFEFGDPKENMTARGINHGANGHLDFMIGKSNMDIYFEKAQSDNMSNVDDKVLLVKDNKYAQALAA